MGWAWRGATLTNRGADNWDVERVTWDRHVTEAIPTISYYAAVAACDTLALETAAAAAAATAGVGGEPRIQARENVSII